MKKTNCRSSIAMAGPILSPISPRKKAITANKTLSNNEFNEAMVARWWGVNSFWRREFFATSVAPYVNDVDDINIGEMGVGIKTENI